MCTRASRFISAWVPPPAGRCNQLPSFGKETLPVNPPAGGGIVTPGCFSSSGDFGRPLNSTRPGYGSGVAKEGPCGTKTTGSPSEETLTRVRGAARKGREPPAEPPPGAPVKVPGRPLHSSRYATGLGVIRHPCLTNGRYYYVPYSDLTSAKTSLSESAVAA
jgi:hypothetical protein